MIVVLTPPEAASILEAFSEAFRAGVLQDYAAANRATSKIEEAMRIERAMPHSAIDVKSEIRGDRHE